MYRLFSHIDFGPTRVTQAAGQPAIHQNGRRGAQAECSIGKHRGRQSAVTVLLRRSERSERANACLPLHHFHITTTLRYPDDGLANRDAKSRRCDWQ
jgi:hypothetical protein